MRDDVSGSQHRHFLIFSQNGGAGCARTGRAGQAHIKSDCSLALGADRCVFRASGRVLITEQGFNGECLCCPLWRFQKAMRSKKIHSFFFIFRRRGRGRSRAESARIFWVARASTRGRPRRAPGRPGRMLRVRNTTHAARAKSGFALEMGSRKG